VGSVAGTVVGQHVPHDDHALSEPGVGIPKRCCGVFALIGQRLAVGRPGVPINGGMQVVVAVQGLRYLLCLPELLPAQVLRLPAARPSVRQPPPAGILPPLVKSAADTSRHSGGGTCRSE
jgi:hypothetical protein